MLLGEIVCLLSIPPSPSCKKTHTKQDLDKEDEVPLQQVDYRLLEPYVKQDVELKKQRDELKAKILYDHKGFCKEGGEGDGY